MIFLVSSGRELDGGAKRGVGCGGDVVAVLEGKT
jgi:hypothetical protein